MGADESLNRQETASGLSVENPLGQAGVRIMECHGGHRSTCRLVRFAASHAVPSRVVPWCGWSSAGYQVVSAPSGAPLRGSLCDDPYPRRVAYHDTLCKTSVIRNVQLSKMVIRLHTLIAQINPNMQVAKPIHLWWELLFQHLAIMIAQFIGVCSWLQLVYMYTSGP